MTFVFATLAFVVAAWVAVIVLAATLEDYGSQVLAALAGRNPASPLPALSVRVRQRYPAARTVRLQARPRLRAAA